MSNVESDSEVKTRAMNFILREVCKKYREGNDPTFSPEEVKRRLGGLGPKYLDLNIKDLLKGSGFIDIDDNFNLTLNDRGRKACEKGELLD
jgi:hypothetical protein